MLLRKGTLECYLVINAQVFQVFYFSQFSPSKIFYPNFLSTIHATCPAPLILLDFITRILFGKVDSRLQSLVSTSLLTSSRQIVLFVVKYNKKITHST